MATFVSCNDLSYVLSKGLSLPRQSFIWSSNSTRDIEPLRYCLRLDQYVGALVPRLAFSWALIVAVGDKDIVSHED